MISEKEIQQILNKGTKKYSLEKARQLRDFLYRIARLQVNAYLRFKQHQSQCGNLFEPNPQKPSHPSKNQCNGKNHLEK